MGDYTKLIVHAEVRVLKEDLLRQVTKLGLCESAYHCSGIIKSIESTSTSGVLSVSLIGQTKYGARQEEFLSWLEPYVVQGSGPLECWAVQFTEHSDSPRLWCLEDPEESC